jgi:hypothetical protein
MRDCQRGRRRLDSRKTTENLRTQFRSVEIRIGRAAAANGDRGLELNTTEAEGVGDDA